MREKEQGRERTWMRALKDHKRNLSMMHALKRKKEKRLKSFTFLKYK